MKSCIKSMIEYLSDWKVVVAEVMKSYATTTSSSWTLINPSGNII